MNDKLILNLLEEQSFKEIDNAINFLKEMIKIPTENPPGKNYLKFSTFFLLKLKEMGYVSKIIKVPKNRLKELVRFGEGPRFAVVGKKGKGNIKIAFNGHYDVVPAGAGWKYPPFNPVIENGYLYGRGSSDMKSGLAMQLYAIKILENVFPNIYDKLEIIQTAVPDEETVGNKNAGTYFLVEKGILTKKNTDLVVFTEPQGLTNIYMGHRGATLINIRIKGEKSHGSMPQLGKSAINAACEIINNLNSSIYEKENNKTSKYEIIPEESKKPTISINTINCGTWVNTVADDCTFSVFRRLIPEESLNEVRNEIKNIIEKSIKNTNIKVEINENYSTESVIENTNNIYYRSYAEAIREVFNKDAKFVLSPGTFDIRFTHNAGIPSLNYGPGILEEAHRTDEKVKIEDIRTAMIVTALAVYKIATGDSNFHI